MIAGAIATCLRETGLRVGVFKPVASGCRAETDGRLISEDAEFLAECAGRPHSAEEVTPLRFVEPLAPNVAAQRAGQTVNLERVFQAYQGVVAGSDCVVMEGVGGLLCPLRDDFCVIHFAKLCQLPLVVVARPGLGTINHTLLTLHAARSAGLEVAGVVINRYPGDSEDAAVRTNPRQIAERGDVAVLATVPDDGESSIEDMRLGGCLLAAVKEVDWAGMLQAQQGLLTEGRSIQ
jgi:dethiobiotin synthetase